MNVVDTSGWLELFGGGKNSHVFFELLKDIGTVVVPTICIYEIPKVLLRESDEQHLLQVLAAIQRGRGVELTISITTAAAKVSIQYKLLMADSKIYAEA